VPDGIQKGGFMKGLCIVGRFFLDVQCVADSSQLVDVRSGVSFYTFHDALCIYIVAIVVEKL